MTAPAIWKPMVAGRVIVWPLCSVVICNALAAVGVGVGSPAAGVDWPGIAVLPAVVLAGGGDAAVVPLVVQPASRTAAAQPLIAHQTARRERSEVSTSVLPSVVDIRTLPAAHRVARASCSCVRRWWPRRSRRR